MNLFGNKKEIQIHKSSLKNDNIDPRVDAISFDLDETRFAVFTVEVLNKFERDNRGEIFYIAKKEMQIKDDGKDAYAYVTHYKMNLAYFEKENLTGHSYDATLWSSFQLREEYVRENGQPDTWRNYDKVDAAEIFKTNYLTKAEDIDWTKKKLKVDNNFIKGLRNSL